MKRRYELTTMQVDAFTDVPFGGNPATVVLGADPLSEETMLKIAREASVRETVFVTGSKVADFRGLRVKDSDSTEEERGGEYFYCPSCEFRLHADVNAARNILKIQIKPSAVSGRTVVV